jgi:TIR domain
LANAFISYSHRDEKALDRLHTHLAMLHRENLITAWYDRKILAGDDFGREISSHLADSDLFLALVSPDFLASNYCYEQEMENALKRHADGTLRVIPIILEPCDWESSPLGKLKALPKDGKPISTWTNENVAYFDVVTELRRLIGTTEKNLNDPTAKPQGPSSSAASQPSRRYRIKRDFDSIDRDKFRRQAFAIIEEYFRRSIDELNAIGDPIRAHFENMGSGAFTCTVLNKASRTKEAHITVRNGDDDSFGRDAIVYSFSRRERSSANGFIHVEANEYELYLKSDGFGFRRAQDSEHLSAEEAADGLWREFISHAGIEHE